MVKVSFSKNYQDNLAIMNCLKSADHPMNKTGGPEWDNIDENIALKICNQAFKKNPNSIKIIRSLARIYFKKKEFTCTFCVHIYYWGAFRIFYSIF